MIILSPSVCISRVMQMIILFQHMLLDSAHLESHVCIRLFDFIYKKMTTPATIPLNFKLFVYFTSLIFPSFTCCFINLIRKSPNEYIFIPKAHLISIIILTNFELVGNTLHLLLLMNFLVFIFKHIISVERKFM